MDDNTTLVILFGIAMVGFVAICAISAFSGPVKAKKRTKISSTPEWKITTPVKSPGIQPAKVQYQPPVRPAGSKIKPPPSGK